jgi:hypothetical protein
MQFTCTLRYMHDSTVPSVEYSTNQHASENNTARPPCLAPRLTKIPRLLLSFPRFPPFDLDSPSTVSTKEVRSTVGPNARSRCCVLVVSRSCKRLITVKDVPLIETVRPVTIYVIHLPVFLLVLRQAIDLFVFYSEYHVLVYKPYAYTVTPPHLTAHIATKHANDIYGRDSLRRATTIAATVTTRLKEEHDLLNPTTSIIPRLLPAKPPFPDLKLYRGY